MLEPQLFDNQGLSSPKVFTMTMAISWSGIHVFLDSRLQHAGMTKKGRT
jgi:hypothetical protein